VSDEDRDRRLHSRARPVRPGRDGRALSRRARRLLHPRVHPDVDDAGDGAANHVRYAHADGRASTAARSALLRSQSGWTADDPRHDRRGRLERPVHVRSGVVFGDVFTLVGIMVVLVWMDWRLALVAFSVLPLIALITQWFRVNVRETYRA